MSGDVGSRTIGDAITVETEKDADRDILWSVGPYEQAGANTIYNARRGEGVQKYVADAFFEKAEDKQYLPPIGAVTIDHNAVIDPVERQSRRYADGVQQPDASLDVLDTVCNDTAVEVYHPSNLSDTLENMYARRRQEQVLTGLDDLGEEVDVYSVEVTGKHPDSIGDECIAAAAEELSAFHETTLVLTTDEDFLDIEEDYDIVALPPDAATDVLEYQQHEYDI